MAHVEESLEAKKKVNLEKIRQFRMICKKWEWLSLGKNSLQEAKKNLFFGLCGSS